VAVEVVFTERRSELTPERARNYERLRERVAAASGEVVQASHYEEVDPDRLARAGAIVLSGSTAPWAVHDPAELERLGEAVRAARRPALGICAGMQLLGVFAGGALGPCAKPEHGFLPVCVNDASDLLRDLPREVIVFHDHTDEITTLPRGFRILASSRDCRIQAIGDSARRWWGTQFHPEEYTPEHEAGKQVLERFFALLR
jgi:GMP synthase-like glutamine amidotransferase